MIYNTELYHHGIKGQKWGIRRFQNEDGSYTSAGKQRYNISDVGNDILKKRSKFNKDWHDTNSTKNKRMLARQERKHQINKSYKKANRIADEELFNAVHKNPRFFVGPDATRTFIRSSTQASIYNKGGHQGRKAVRRISKRMDKGDSYETAFKKELGRQASVRAGKEIAKKILVSAVIPTVAGLAIMKYNESRGIHHIVQNHYYDPIDVTKKYNKIN